jgi:hypothetical protein
VYDLDTASPPPSLLATTTPSYHCPRWLPSTKYPRLELSSKSVPFPCPPTVHSVSMTAATYPISILDLMTDSFPTGWVQACQRLGWPWHCLARRHPTILSRTGRYREGIRCKAFCPGQEIFREEESQGVTSQRWRHSGHDTRFPRKVRNLQHTPLAPAGPFCAVIQHAPVPFNVLTSCLVYL